MALYGIVSDIHGNLPAFVNAIEFLVEHRRVDKILCLGDIVGYNAEPDACVRLTRELSIDSVAGNHDLIALGSLDLQRCALRPAFALRRTRRVLHQTSRQLLAALPSRRLIEDDIVLVHGGFRDVCQYVTTPERVAENGALMLRDLPRARICFFGHTHEQKLYELHKGTAVERAPGNDTCVGAENEITLAGPDRTFFVNPGSIDAARKNGPKLAELAVFDSTRRTVTFHRIPYDHESAERSAAAHGYRMTLVEERLRAAARALARKKTAALRHLVRLLASF